MEQEQAILAGNNGVEGRLARYIFKISPLKPFLFITKKSPSCVNETNNSFLTIYFLCGQSTQK